MRVKTKPVKLDTPFDTFKKIFIYYWLFSLVGHYGENVWAFSHHLVTGEPFKAHIVSTIIPLASPYGLGAIAVILLVWPLIKTHKINPFITFALNVIIAGIVEYLCAIIAVIFYGHNYFWDYSMKPFNINGFICLESVVVFGIAATIFIYFVYPFIEKIIKRFTKQQLSIIFWILFISYIADTIYTYTK